MIGILLLDLDDTILDFHKAERIALSKTLRDHGLEPSEQVLTLYHEINKWHWNQLELGKMNREQVLLGRFTTLFRELGQEEKGADCAESYEENLALGHHFLPGAEEALKRLFGKYRLFLMSNGTAKVQKGRLTSANLYRFFEQVFISQEIGYNKPEKAFFDTCFARIPGFRQERALMVGDSLTSDIQGGINAGVKTVWVNPEGRSWDRIRPDYEIRGLGELETLLEKMQEVDHERIRAGV